jgi:hypothetical protein
MQHPIESIFPNLGVTGYGLTSPRDPNYNCIAWAANDTTRVWWPSPFAYWPPAIPRVPTIEAFEQAFDLLGYRPTSDGSLQAHYEKVALFTKDGLPTHMARQLPDGAWTSKLGRLEDIRHHDISAVSGAEYGSVAAFYRRQRTDSN